MPFDGTGYEKRIEAIAKLDQVISLLPREEQWCKGRIETADGRRCLLGAMRAANAQATLKAPILAAIAQVTGHQYRSIPRFNDDLNTTHPLVLQVLRQARHDIETGVVAPRPALQPRWMARLGAHCRSLLGACL